MLVLSRVNNGLKDALNACYSTKHSLFFPRLDAFVQRHKNVLIIKRGPEYGEDKPILVAASNIITNAGDTYYAQSAVGETPTDSFANLYYSSVDFSPSPTKTSDAGDLASVIAGSSVAATATYPKTNDGDSDNSGAGVDIVTWLFTHSKASFNDSDIDAGCIAEAGATFGTGSDPLLTAFDTSAFEKTANDSLKTFINHTMNGV